MYETLLKPDDVNERCGLILEGGEAIELENVAADPTQGFEMNPVEVLSWIHHAVATWHTHPNAASNLSGADYNTFLAWPDLRHIVISPAGVKTYQADNGVVLECV